MDRTVNLSNTNRRRRCRAWLPTVIGGLLFAGTPAIAASDTAAAGALTLERKIPLGEVRGRIDHLAVDLTRRRLFVAELGNGSVSAVDIAEGKLLRRIGGLKEPQGIGYVAGTDTIYVANAGDGSVHRYRGLDLSPAGTIDLGEDADNIRVDARTNQVAVGYGSGAIALIDAGTGARTGDIPLPAHPESFQLAPDGSRIFVNLPDARQIALIDRAAGRQVAAWTLPGEEANFPMAFDAGGDRLFVVYRKPALLAAFDARNGAAVARMPTCGDADDVFFDAKRRRVYVSCGEGVLAVVQREEGDAYREIARIQTVPGARTSLFVPDLDRLFLAVRAGQREPASVWVFRPDP
jgi:DNA-binding beta-propeller fold protein YncE